MEAGAAEDRLRRAEHQGLRLAILCRTLAVGAAFVWLFAAATPGGGYGSNPWAISALLAFMAFGIVTFSVIGTRFDRWWLKYLIYAVDILGLCALFVIIPVSRTAEVPQIIAFRAYGIYYLFPLIAMACLSLSWPLVVWSGAVAVVGWWAAFGVVASDMERRLSWGDMPAGATREDYESVFLSIDFVGLGNRVEETGFLLITALILAIAVYRARKVFFAQIAAEAERAAERATRERIAATLGRFVPEAIAKRLIADPEALAPHVQHGVVLIMDIKGFTAFAAQRDPKDVITNLNAFLARCAELVSGCDGVVISFTGDGLLAAFNTPIDIAQPERVALDAAQAMTEEAKAANFAIRIGIAAGPIAAGSVGSSQRQAFTIYGDTVNRAARLETLAKELNESILFDDAVAKAVGESCDLRTCGHHALRGFNAPVAVWALSSAKAERA